MSTAVVTREMASRSLLDLDESASELSSSSGRFNRRDFQTGGATGASVLVLPTEHSTQNSAGSLVRTFREVLYVAIKRCMDVAISLCALIVLSPVFLVAAVLIKRHDGGPIFFTQERVGLKGRSFECFKFRSMVLNAQELQSQLMDKSEHADPRTFKMANDPRITPPGRFIRRFSIDELPQLLNVLFGQMSIVGPRPPLPREVELYTESDHRRLDVKPGLTCIWQVSGRSRLPFPEQVRLDVDYIQRRSVLLDVVIIAKTIPAVLGGDGAA